MEIQPTPIRIRFFQRLNDFLPFYRRHCSFLYVVKGHPSIKDTIEALGVPHTEVDGIRVNNIFVDFFHQLKGGETIGVYAVAPQGHKARLIHLKSNPRGRPKFVLDSHLGKLVRSLRLLGFDAYYLNIFPDEKIVNIAMKENRIVLTRDIGLLKNRPVRRGYWVRSDNPARQLKEIVREYKLQNQLKPFSRCLACNGKICRIAKKKVLGRLPENTKDYYREFYRCRGCDKIYWQGAHYQKLADLIARVRSGRFRS